MISTKVLWFGLIVVCCSQLVTWWEGWWFNREGTVCRDGWQECGANRHRWTDGGQRIPGGISRSRGRLLTLCILGNFLCFFVVCWFFSKLTFWKNSFRNTISVSNGLDPDQDRHFVGPGLGPNCLQRLAADDRWTDGRQIIPGGKSRSRGGSIPYPSSLGLKIS